MNRAGGISNWESPVIVGDLTPPVTKQTIASGSAKSSDIVFMISDSGLGLSVVGYIGPDNRQIRHTVQCNDREFTLLM